MRSWPLALPHGFQMTGTHLIRSLKRPFAAGVVWAMIPLAVWGGIPVTQCACLFCQCGTDCSFRSQCSCSNASDDSSQGCSCGSCSCNHCSCAAGHCNCCQSKQGAAKPNVCDGACHAGFSSQTNGCRTSVSATVAVRANAVVVGEQLPLAFDVANSTAHAQSYGASNAARPLDSRPPPDLVITLQRLVI